MVTYSSQNIENYSNMAYLSKFLQFTYSNLFLLIQMVTYLSWKMEKYSNMAYSTNFLLQILLTPHSDDLPSLKMFPKYRAV